MLRPPMTRNVLIAIKDRWISLFHEHKGRGEPNATEMWLDALFYVMAARGDEILPRELLNRERALIEQGHGEALALALASILRVDNEGQVGYLLLARGEQRMKAIEQVEAELKDDAAKT
jgi:hypothetical protein